MPRKKALLITYNTRKEKFDSVYERNKFYRGLFGYRQTVKKNGKTYRYEKDGLMDRIPNSRIDDSVFIVSKDNITPIQNYFNQWGEKISHHCFEVILKDQEIIDSINRDIHDQ